jgi:hypothetical protein
MIISKFNEIRRQRPLAKTVMIGADLIDEMVKSEKKHVKV